MSTTAQLVVPLVLVHPAAGDSRRPRSATGEETLGYLRSAWVLIRQGVRFVRVVVGAIEKPLWKACRFLWTRFIQSVRAALSLIGASFWAVLGVWRVLGIVLAALVFVFSPLAVANLSAKEACAFDHNWFGCVMRTHEDLAGGLLGAAFTLVAALVAWRAVHAQIDADRALATADRNEALRLLSDALAHHAEGMAAAWRILDNLPDDADEQVVNKARRATAYMVETIARPELIKSYRQMIEALPWEKRLGFGNLINGLEQLGKFRDTMNLKDFAEVLDHIRDASVYFELCIPTTSAYFEGLWRRQVKAWTFGDHVRHIAGLEV